MAGIATAWTLSSRPPGPVTTAVLVTQPVATAGASAVDSASKGRFHVVIDPGHGGSNTGAAGVVEGLYEKRFTLLLARQLARRLEGGGVRATLTRTTDTYLTLRQRARIANERAADLFVSLHANASPSRSQSGFETYILTADALDVDTRAMRQDDGALRPGASAEVAHVLDDIERGASLGRAADLAVTIQEHLAAVRPDSPDRGVKQASMDVLMGPTMPAVLVEVGFFDEPTEGAELLTSETRADIVDALALAIFAHLGRLRAP